MTTRMDARSENPTATTTAATTAAAAATTGGGDGARGPRSVNVDDLTRAAARRAHLIDVRSPAEYAAGHIPGAVNVPMDQAEARLADLPPAGEEVVIVCQSGKRAAMTCDLLRAERPDLAVLTGGTSAWEAAGLPLVRTTATRWSLDRQVRLGAGLLVLTGTLLSVFAAPAWVYLAMFVGAGLTFAGLTGVCGMAAVLAKMPWNQPRKR